MHNEKVTESLTYYFFLCLCNSRLYNVIAVVYIDSIKMYSTFERELNEDIS
jgi:hypothetical protein